MFNLMNLLAIGVTDSSSGLTAEEIAQQTQELQDKKIWLAILIVLLIVEIIVAVAIPRIKKQRAEKAEQKAKRKPRHSKKK